MKFGLHILNRSEHKIFSTSTNENPKAATVLYSVFPIYTKKHCRIHPQRRLSGSDHQDTTAYYRDHIEIQNQIGEYILLALSRKQ